ncbi:MAG: 4Fe-4S binding protein [Desulfobacterales bacterium]|nr:4Fe-4S binding protein [Desulfobacterales bacterium]
MLKIDHSICNLCGLCQKSCPFGAISADAEKVTVDERCTLCGACVNVCPQSALSIERRQASAEELAKYRGVFVWTECEERGKKQTPRKVVYELLTHGLRVPTALSAAATICSGAIPRTGSPRPWRRWWPRRSPRCCCSEPPPTAATWPRGWRRD